MAVRSGESRLRLLDLLQAVAKEFLAIGVGRLLAKELLRALAGKLPGVFGQLVACMLEAIVDFSPRAGEYLLRLGFSGRDQLAFLTFALHPRARGSAALRLRAALYAPGGRRPSDPLCCG